MAANLTFADQISTVTVASPGATAGATTIPTQPTISKLYSGWTLTFHDGYTATLTADAPVGSTSLAVSALANTLATGDWAYVQVVLTNGKPAPGNRFANWVTQTKPIGDSAHRQSDGALSTFVYRTDYGASFDLPGIPVAAVAGERMTDYADRLIAWLLQGGAVWVETGDAAANIYGTCGLMPGTTPSLTLTDRVNLEYTLRLSLINLAASPVRMVCHYVT